MTADFADFSEQFMGVGFQCREGCHRSDDSAKHHQIQFHPMKAQITLDFLRGILFSYIASRAWVFLHAVFLGMTPFQPVQAILSASLFLIYASLLLALLFRPISSAKAVFMALSLLAIFSVGSVGFTLVLSRQPSFSSVARQHSELFSISNHSLPLFLAIGSAPIAYLFYRKQKIPLQSAEIGE